MNEWLVSTANGNQPGLVPWSSSLCYEFLFVSLCTYKISSQCTLCICWIFSGCSRTICSGSEGLTASETDFQPVLELSLPPLCPPPKAGLLGIPCWKCSGFLAFPAANLGVSFLNTASSIPTALSAFQISQVFNALSYFLNGFMLLKEFVRFISVAG